MKVLMIGPARSVNGGVSAVVNDYYRAGLDREVELDYIGTMEDGNKWHKLFVAIKALFRFLAVAGNYDIIHIHMASDVSVYRKIPFIRIAGLYGKRVIIHQHGGNFRQFFYKECSSGRQRMIREVLNRADIFLVIAPYLEEIFSDIVEKDKVILFPNSIILPEITGKDYQGQKILFLGRLCKEKGIEELLEACRRLKGDYPGLQLFLGGRWEDESLKAKADVFGDWVHQLGWIGAQEKERYLQECNIFVLPSYFEGHPVSLLEGMVYRCACIGTDIGGITQMLREEENGLVVPIKDSSSLEAALRRYLEDPDLQEKLGRAAGETIRQNYDLEKNIKKLVQIYKRRRISDE